MVLPRYHDYVKSLDMIMAFLRCLTLVLLVLYTCTHICQKSNCVQQVINACDSYCMNRLQTFSGLSNAWLKMAPISLSLNLLSVVCSCTDEALSFQADAPPLWLLRCCHGNRGSVSLACRHQSVSSIPGVYFWVMGERLNVYALLAPAAPLKSKLEIGIIATDSWRLKSGLIFSRITVS